MTFLYIEKKIMWVNMYSLTEILISLTSTKENFPTSKIGDGKSKIQEYLIFMTLKSTNCL